jgi:hypothetical protein
MTLFVNHCDATSHFGVNSGGGRVDGMGNDDHDGQLAALRSAGKEILEAEEAHRMSPTLDHASRLARARRALEDALRLAPPGPASS